MTRHDGPSIEHLYDTGMSIESELAEVAGRLNLENATLVRLGERVVIDRVWQETGMRSPAEYLALRAGLSPERAKAIVRVAERRSEFPVVMAAFERGELSLEQVVEAVKAPAWADSLVAGFVSIAPVSKLRRAMRSNMFEGHPDEPDAEPIPACDRVSFGVGRDGRWRIRGELGADEGRRVEAALAERKDALFGAGDETVTWPEAFVSCFDRSLGSVESIARREHYRTWFHIDVSDGAMTTTDGWQVPMAIREHVLCDGVVQPVWERDGSPFSVGRAQRIVPDRTRHIVERRDRGCRVPGCTADRFVEVHHIVHWSAGGRTDTPNLISLCPKHHRMHHQGGLGVSGNADRFDRVVFTDSNGKVIGGVDPPIVQVHPPPRPHNGYDPPLTGRFDWNWIGLGWVHPEQRERLRAQAAHARPGAA